MFNRLFKSGKKQDVFFDIEENAEDAPLLEVVIEKGDEKFKDTPELELNQTQQAKQFLADEIKECLNILLAVQKNATVSKEKLDAVQKYGRLIYLIQTAFSLGISGAAFATINYFSEQLNVPNKNSRIHTRNQLSQKYIEKNQTRNRVEREVNSLAIKHDQLNDLPGAYPIEEKLAAALYFRMMKQDDWWTNSSDNYNFIDTGSNYTFIESQKIQNWSPYHNGWYEGSCSTWSNHVNTYYISSLFPEFNGTNFCQLTAEYRPSSGNSHPFQPCNEIAASICRWDDRIDYMMRSVENYTLSTAFNNLLNSQRELSQLEFEINQLQAKAHATTPFFKNPYTYIKAGAGLALIGCLMGLAYKFKKAYNEYKEELAHIYDLDRCISDPKILNRLINLTARLNIPMKDAKLDTLIAGLKNSLEEVVARRRLRLGIGLFCAAQTEELQRPDQGAWKDIMPLILEHADYAAAQQAPKPRCSSSD